MSGIFNKVQDYFVPSGLNIVETHRANVLVWMLITIFAISVVMFPLSFWIKSSFPYYYLFLGICLLLIVLKTTQAFTIVANLTVSLVFFTIAFTSFMSGGIYSHDLAGLFLVLVLSISLLDIKYTYIYGFLILAFTFYMYYLSEDTGQLDRFSKQREQYGRGYYLVVCSMFSLLPMVFLTVISRLNSRLISNLRSANSQLDITNSELDKERVKLIQAKSELEKSNLKLERYAHTASHDLQQPIRTIVSFTQLLSKKLERLDIKDEKIEDYLAQVISGTKRMDTQVQDLLSFSKVSSKEESHIYSLNEIVEDVKLDLSDMISRSEVELTVGKLPSVNVIKSNLSQVIQNLVSNAIKYKKPSTKARIKISSYQKDDDWVICVSDNGIGIGNQDVNKIFRLYSQSSKENEGLGIGLATCQQIIESYGGQIWVESELGKGSQFFFTLPKIITSA